MTQNHNAFYLLQPVYRHCTNHSCLRIYWYSTCRPAWYSVITGVMGSWIETEDMWSNFWVKSGRAEQLENENGVINATRGMNDAVGRNLETVRYESDDTTSSYLLLAGLSLLRHLLLLLSYFSSAFFIRKCHMGFTFPFTFGERWSDLGLTITCCEHAQ